MILPERITILCYGTNEFCVINDGRISDKLCWDEMLGHVASLTLTGKPRYPGWALDSFPLEAEGRWWNPKPLQLTGEVEHVQPKNSQREYSRE